MRPTRSRSARTPTRKTCSTGSRSSNRAAAWPASSSGCTRRTWARSRYEPGHRQSRDHARVSGIAERRRMTAIVTGAARGIGAAVADRLAAEHDVLRVDLDPSVDGIVADVTKPEDRQRILDAVD